MTRAFAQNLAIIGMLWDLTLTLKEHASCNAEYLGGQCRCCNNAENWTEHALRALGYSEEKS